MIQPAKKEILIGAIFILIFIGGFLLWSFILDIESAAVAQGHVIVSGRSKSVQHQKGGTVEKVLIKEGDSVDQGDPLIKLDIKQEKIQKNLLLKQQDILRLIEARLIAERDDKKSIAIQKGILHHLDNPEIQKVLGTEVQLFEKKHQTYLAQLTTLNERIKELNNLTTIIEEQANHIKTQINLVSEEVKELKILVEKKLIGKPRLLSLQREEARLLAELQKTYGQLTETKKNLYETLSQKNQLIAERKKEILEELEKVRSNLIETEQKLNSVQEVIDKSVITSPIKGIIYNLKIHAGKEVIKPGDVIATVVPTEDFMIVEAKVNPLDIDMITEGLKAEVRLNPYNPRRLIKIFGKVVYISPDIVTNPQTRRSYYIVHVMIPNTELEKHKGIKLTPGMPVDVLIINDKRTLFEYLIGPITRSFNRAFREE